MKEDQNDRMGRRHRPFFRINAVESKTPRTTASSRSSATDPIEKNASSWC